MKFRPNPHSVKDPLLDSIRSARCELDRAAVLFNELTDDAGVDYASYNLLAAKARYSHLLRMAKEKDLSV